MEFFVFVDRTGAEGPAIHKESCHCVRGRRKHAVGTRWYGPFPRRRARQVAKKEAGARLVRDAPRCCGGVMEARTARGA